MTIAIFIVSFLIGILIGMNIFEINYRKNRLLELKIRRSYEKTIRIQDSIINDLEDIIEITK